MGPRLRSELIKLGSTRTIYGLVAGAIFVVALSTFSTISSAGAVNLTGGLQDEPFFFLASVILGVFAVIVGIRSVTDEFRHGTVVPSILSGRHRGRFLVAKAAVTAAAAAVLAMLAQAAMVGITVALAGESGSFRLTGHDWSAMAGLTAASALWATIGVGVGAVVRHQLAAIVGAVIWVLVIENVGSGLLGAPGRYLPGQAAHGLAGIPELLAVGTGAAVLLAYAVASLASGYASITRRDL